MPKVSRRKWWKLLVGLPLVGGAKSLLPKGVESGGGWCPLEGSRPFTPQELQAAWNKISIKWTVTRYPLHDEWVYVPLNLPQQRTLFALVEEKREKIQIPSGVTITLKLES